MNLTPIAISPLAPTGDASTVENYLRLVQEAKDERTRLGFRPIEEGGGKFRRGPPRSTWPFDSAR